MIGESGTLNFVEHSVIAESTRKTKLLRALIIVSSSLVFIVNAAIFSSFAGPFLVLLPMLLVVIIYFAIILWKYTNKEFDYTIAGGELKVCSVYGGRKRKSLFCIKISAIQSMVSYYGYAPKEADSANIEYKCVSSLKAPEIVCLVFYNEEGKKCVAYIEVIKKVKSALKFYNSNAYKIT